jgi:hypothetical protein
MYSFYYYHDKYWATLFWRLESLSQFAENRRIANKAVQKAIEENRKYGILDE